MVNRIGGASTVRVERIGSRRSVTPFKPGSAGKYGEALISGMAWRLMKAIR